MSRVSEFLLSQEAKSRVFLHHSKIFSLNHCSEVEDSLSFSLLDLQGNCRVSLLKFFSDHVDLFWSFSSIVDQGYPTPRCSVVVFEYYMLNGSNLLLPGRSGKTGKTTIVNQTFGR